MEIHALFKDTFQEQISHGITLVDFYTPGNNACLEQLNIDHSLAQEVRYQAAVAKVNIDQEQELAAEYNVSSGPTLLLFKDGYKVETLVGLQSKEVLQKYIISYATMSDSCV
ncbi:co-chaperone YbbN [Paenibacillus sp. CF384]|uniref:thioredoxin family protein n=1 Tax=Paenibacillus sp. CF384 TaxID=1884382 RepID=UPI000894FC43|nr:thioredoxin domain-containing protein [Paenibacillus sp. CF384]SDW06630.1 thioredoxin 1 [Paenibacillus sp. CF384]